MTDVSTGPGSGPSRGPQGTRRWWPIGFAAVVIALLVAILVVLIRDDDPETAGESSATTAPTEVVGDSEQAATTAVPGPDEIPSAPPCTPEALLAGQNLSLSFVVDDYACTPTSLESVPGAYAWALMSDPSAGYVDEAGVEVGSTPIVVVYYGDTVDGRPLGRWEMVGYTSISVGSSQGEDIPCDAFLPAAACNAMPGSPG